MAFQFPVMNSLLMITVIVLVIAIIAIFLILILLKLYQVKSAARGKPGKNIQPVTSARPPALKVKEEMPGEEPARPGYEPEPGGVLSDRGDISKNMQALVAMYHLDSFTLSSDDGLLIASTSEEGQNDAANYSQIYKSSQEPIEPGTKIFGMNHGGSTIIGIIRSSHTISDQVVEKIERDAKIILGWGL